MKLLLDTHIFIWWADQPEKLSHAVLSALEDEANELLLSVASVWEMQIKIQLGKLKLSLPLKDLGAIGAKSLLLYFRPWSSKNQSRKSSDFLRIGSLKLRISWISWRGANRVAIE